MPTPKVARSLMVEKIPPEDSGMLTSLAQSVATSPTITELVHFSRRNDQTGRLESQGFEDAVMIDLLKTLAGETKTKPRSMYPLFAYTGVVQGRKTGACVAMLAR